MGNSESKIDALYKQHLIKLARPDIDPDANKTRGQPTPTISGESIDEKVPATNDMDGPVTIPLFNREMESIGMDFLISFYNGEIHDMDIINSTPIFNGFYEDFINAAQTLSAETFNSLISSNELRKIFKINPQNFINLLRFAILKIILITNYLSLISLPGNNSNNINRISSASSNSSAQSSFMESTSGSSTNEVSLKLNHLLISIRILTKLFPIYLETTGNKKKISIDFWKPDSIQAIFGIDSINIGPEELALNSLGESLLTSCVKLCFIQGFTIPLQSNVKTMTTSNKNNKPGKFSLIMWENGIETVDIGYSPNNQSPKLDSNRLQIISLLLTLCSKDLYQQPTSASSSSSSSSSNNEFLLHFSSLPSTSATSIPSNSMNNLMTYFTSSLVNTVCQYCLNYNLHYMNPYKENTNLNYKLSNNQNLSILKSSLIQSSVQLLNLLLLSNPNVSITTNTIKNHLSNLKRERDLKLLLSAFVKIFKYPIDQMIEVESNPFSFSNDSSSSKINNYDPSLKNNLNINNKPSNTNNNITMTSNNFNAHNDTNTSTTNNSNNNNTSGETNASLPRIPKLSFQMIVFIINLMNANKLFRNYFMDKFANKFIIFAIYFLKFYPMGPSSNPKISTFLQISIELSLSLSSKHLVQRKLLNSFTINYYTNKLPNSFKISNVSNINNLSYRDFAITQLSNILVNDIRSNSPTIHLKPYCYELIYNLLPINQTVFNVQKNEPDDMTPLSSNNQNYYNLNYIASISLLHLLSKSSNKQYLSSFSPSKFSVNNKFNNSIQQWQQKNESENGISPSLPRQYYYASPSFKLDILSILLRSILTYIVTCFRNSKNLIFVLARHHGVLLQLRDSILTISKLIDSENLNLNNFIQFNSSKIINNNLSPQQQQQQQQQQQRMISTNNINNSNNNKLTNNANNDTINNNNNIPLPSNEANLPPFLVAKLNKTLSKRQNNENNNDNDHAEYSDSDEYDDDDNDDDNGGVANNNGRMSMNNGKRVSSKSNNANNVDKKDSDHENKNIQIHEYFKFDNDLELFNLLSTRPNWPSGINSKINGKISNRVSFLDSWSGTESLNVLIKILKLFLTKYPNITTVTTNDYYTLTNKFDDFEDEFLKIITPMLPIPLKDELRQKNREDNHNTNSKLLNPLLLKLNSPTIKNWIYLQCWIDIFNSHSAPYLKPNPNSMIDFNSIIGKAPSTSSLNSQSNSNSASTEVLRPTSLSKTNSAFTIGLGINNNHSADCNDNIVTSKRRESSTSQTRMSQTNMSSSNFPPPPTALERWTSNTSNLSRTTSNGSSIMNYFSQSQQQLSFQEPIMEFQSPLDSSVMIMGNIGSSSPSLNSNKPSSSSFFRFSWSSITKSEQDDTNDAVTNNSEYSPNVNGYKQQHQSSTFVLDQGIINSNIWTSTNIKLFKVTKDYKEEFSFLDMTSSLLKKFRFNNSNEVEMGSNNNINNNTRKSSHSSIFLPKTFV
ncbi:Ecm30p NDAI_0J02440 [Naumovozyma dairenensis CBS 421]|uniref:Uncharacterized protein n=1 Tax=Naumovozyma dairenensis (strain ATCC 10597 / BCRC 20456 / CBS 421 / NBRC 0211 / NRRL Y-12639) TaxID=1071378 RepID=G0WH58_NAUDC|nr:hypothetical protein NDAI_0J02440 [Naumovozyma dairenensis CBS 421]CCD27136.1 hypothetical protein NDAI_0J02440 [Naumovozyma dairenensis CBS 421]